MNQECRTCGAELDRENRVFCSNRCQQVDLSGWFSERYCIERELTPEDSEDPQLAEAFLQQLGALDPYDPRFS